eukprot:TRINITY_DN2019_c0_g3_i2.p1 TRINITY_DN2019_c0_g3~~TRINITY_DN2019_c0_g3_i2.p1  ORF type:complete len:781 (+),score=273.58 TRINITY_DN2019_c0_g3_i2:348-2345(+)
MYCNDDFCETSMKTDGIVHMGSRVFTSSFDVDADEVVIQQENNVLAIDASGRGFAGGKGTGSPRPPAFEFDQGSVSGAGAAHGAPGALSGRAKHSSLSDKIDFHHESNNIYGSVTEPFEFGSGGGNGITTKDGIIEGIGGAGGGKVRVISAGDIFLDNRSTAVYNLISVNGAYGTGGSDNYANGGGGSGGSILLKSGRRVEGSGALLAEGSYASVSGSSGAGGRIAIHTDIFGTKQIYKIAGIQLQDDEIKLKCGSMNDASSYVGGVGSAFIRTDDRDILMYNAWHRTPTVVTPFPYNAPTDLGLLQISRYANVSVTDNMWGANIELEGSSGIVCLGEYCKIDAMRMNARGTILGMDNIQISDYAYRKDERQYNHPKCNSFDLNDPMNVKMTVSKAYTDDWPVDINLMFDNDTTTGVKTSWENAQYVTFDFSERVRITDIELTDFTDDTSHTRIGQDYWQGSNDGVQWRTLETSGLSKYRERSSFGISSFVGMDDTFRYWRVYNAERNWGVWFSEIRFRCYDPIIHFHHAATYECYRRGCQLSVDMGSEGSKISGENLIYGSEIIMNADHLSFNRDIITSDRGYAGNTGPGTPEIAANYTSRCGYVINVTGAGAGHGGRGGASEYRAADCSDYPEPGQGYGSSINPLTPGSGLFKLICFLSFYLV